MDEEREVNRMDRIVLEKKGRRGVVLEPDGTFRRMRIPRDADVGTLLPAATLRRLPVAAPLRTSSFQVRRFATALALVLTVSLAAGIAVYAAPVSYVSLDMTPGISLTLNRFDVVIGTEGTNPEGKALLAMADVLNRTYAEGVRAILGAAQKKGWLISGDTILVSVASEDETKGSLIRQELLERVQEDLDELGIESDIDSEGIGVDRVQAARELGITAGKLEKIERIREAYEEASEDFDLEEWAGRTTKEVLEEVKRVRGSQKDHGNGESPRDDTVTEAPDPTDSEESSDSDGADGPTRGPEPTEDHSGESRGTDSTGGATGLRALYRE